MTPPLGVSGENKTEIVDFKVDSEKKAKTFFPRPLLFFQNPLNNSRFRPYFPHTPKWGVVFAKTSNEYDVTCEKTSITISIY